jgi:hypothetical protein
MDVSSLSRLKGQSLATPLCILGEEVMCTEGAGDGAADDFAEDFFLGFEGGLSELDELPSTSLDILSVSVLRSRCM